MKLHSEILRLAGPSILANITVPLVGMVDMAVVGHLGASAAYSGAALIGGISVGTMLFDLLYWNFGFLRVGTGGLTAQAYGRARAASGGVSGIGAGGNPDVSAGGVSDLDAGGELAVILRRGLGIALASGLLLIALQWVVVQLAFLVVQCSPEVRQLASQYFYIRIWAAPATLSLFVFKGWFIGLQDSVRPMTADLLVNGLNILLSVVLGFGIHLPWGGGAGSAGAVFGGAGLSGTGFFSASFGLSGSGGLHWHGLGFAGVAIGTVLAQWCGFLYCLLATRRYGRLYNMLGISYLLKFHPAKSRIKYLENAQNQSVKHSGRWEYLRMNGDLFLRSVGMIAVYIGFTVISARYGNTVLAVSAILMKFLMVFSYFSDGFAYAGEALTGRFLGEGSREGVRSTVRQTFLWGLGVTGLFLVLYGLCGEPLFRLMTSDSTVIAAGRDFLPWLLVMPIMGLPAFIWDGIFIGATASKDLRNSTLLCAVGFFLVWFLGALLLPHDTSDSLAPTTALHLLMAAYFVHLAIRSVYLTLRYKALRT